MIKFFRKIRQRLLTENKFSKYLIYALGEILLIVIGILVALQINNWNEKSKNRLAEKEALEVIRTNLDEERKRFDSVISQSQESISKAQNLISGNIDSLDFENMVVDIATSQGHWHFNTGYETLTNSNNINLIENKELLNEIMYFYEALYLRLDLMGSYDATFTDTKMEPYLLKYIPTEPKRFDVKKHLTQELDEIHFRNLLIHLIKVNEWKIGIIKNEAFVSMDKIEELLNKELSDMKK